MRKAGLDVLGLSEVRWKDVRGCMTQDVKYIVEPHFGSSPPLYGSEEPKCVGDPTR